jgi:tripartite-type tricarboxylate transporter receptor subunit TctC
MVASGVARAGSDWPTRPVVYITLFPAGGPTDTLSRVVCQELSELTGKQFIVENKGGSGGNVGADAIAKSAPDGYTVGLYSISAHAISPTLYSKLPFDADKDFAAISMLWSVPNMFAIKLDIPAKTLAEFVALAKANPGKYTFATGGAGTSPHICGEMLKQRAGINIMHVPYRGGAPAMQDVLAGQVDMIIDNIPGPLVQVRGNKLRALAVTCPERTPVAPDVPTMAESYPGFQMTSWGGLCGPAGLPPAMVEKASELTMKALTSERLKTTYLGQGATPFWLDPAAAGDFRRAEEQKLAPIIKASGAQVG